MRNTGDGHIGIARIQALNDTIICALALSSYLSAGSVMVFLRAAAAILAGRALAASVWNGSGIPWRRTAGTLLYILIVWSATFSPVPLLGSPDLVRSGAASAVLVLLASRLPGKTTLVLSGAMALCALLAAGAPPHPGLAGELEFAVGAAWPRDWSDVTVTAGLFLLGSAWAASSFRAGRSPTAP